MSDESTEDIPKYRFVEKKVDTSWKDEVRREREAAAKEAASAPKSSSPGGAEAPTAKTAGAEPEGAAGAGKGGPSSRIFLDFLAQMVQQGLMQLGAMESPFTGRREVNLEGAQFTIELLGALQEKTRGNLADQEKRMLGEALRELQLHYVEVAQAVRRQMQKQAKDLKDPKGPKQ